MSVEQAKIPEGYKQTEVGVIPEGWIVKTFKEICTVNQGLQIAIDRRKKFPTSQSKVYITIQYINSSNEPEYIDDYSASVCCGPDDILMTRTGNTGIVVTGETGVFHNNFFKIDFDRAKINTKYFVYYLRSHDCQKTILDKAGISTIPDLNHGDFYSILIPIPDIKEQTVIANALSDVDSLIASLETLISKKSAIKTAAMQQLLTGKKRLPAFVKESEKKVDGQGAMTADRRGVQETEIQADYQGSDQLAGSGATNQAIQVKATQNKALQINASLTKSTGQTAPRPGYKQTELGEIPEDWEVKHIGELFIISAGGDLRKNEYSEIKTIEAPFPIFSNAIQGKGLYGYCKTFDHDGEFITITARGGIGHAEYRNEKFCSIGRLLVLLPSSFVNCVFASNYINQYLNFANESTGVPQLTAPQVSKYKLIIPSPEEQTAIANVLSDMDTELDALQQRLDKTKTIKQGMMQELLTGKTRLV